MPSITKRGKRYLAQVLIHGKRRSKTFDRKADAQAWAWNQELEKKTYDFSGSPLPPIHFLNMFLKTYGDGNRHVRNYLTRFMTALDKPINLITTDDINAWIQSELNRESEHGNGKKLKTSSVERSFVPVRAFFKWALKQKLTTHNPTKGLAKLPEVDHRERIASPEEQKALMLVSGYSIGSVPKTNTQMVCAAFMFACNTGMRTKELLLIEPSWIEGDILYIPTEVTKTQHRRAIMLNNTAQEILKGVAQRGGYPNIWGITPDQKDALFRKLRDKCGLHAKYDSQNRVIHEGLNFHDSRATFCTWAASPGPDGAPRLDVMSLARQTGHKNLKMLMKYYRPKMQDLVGRLNE